MDSKQISMIVATVVAFSSAMIATPIMAQNMGWKYDRWKYDGWKYDR
jgi:hypothetical protein